MPPQERPGGPRVPPTQPGDRRRTRQL